MEIPVVAKKSQKCENSKLNRPSLLNARNFEIETLESSDFSMYPIFDEQAFDSKSCQRSAHYRSDTLKIRGPQAFQFQFLKKICRPVAQDHRDSAQSSMSAGDKNPHMHAWSFALIANGAGPEKLVSTQLKN